jgi:hypothetical protein
MSKKHFEDAARKIRELVEAGMLAEAQACFNLICDINDNPRFDCYRFRVACGLVK